MITYDNSNLSKDISIITIFFLLFLMLGDLFLYDSSPGWRWIELIIQIVGAFAATFIGIYISLEIDRLIEINSSKDKRNKVLDGSFLLIHSELTINIQMIVETLYALETLPLQPDLFELLEVISAIFERARTKIFYSSVNSGMIHEIDTKGAVFQSLTEAYLNLELSQSDLRKIILKHKNISRGNAALRTLHLDQVVESTQDIKDFMYNLRVLKTTTERAEGNVKDFLVSMGHTYN